MTRYSVRTDEVIEQIMKQARGEIKERLEAVAGRIVVEVFADLQLRITALSRIKPMGDIEVVLCFDGSEK